MLEETTLSEHFVPGTVQVATARCRVLNLSLVGSRIWGRGSTGSGSRVLGLGSGDHVLGSKGSPARVLGFRFQVQGSGSWSRGHGQGLGTVDPQGLGAGHRLKALARAETRGQGLRSASEGDSPSTVAPAVALSSSNHSIDTLLFTWGDRSLGAIRRRTLRPS
eukprot:3807858-Rhodomonas_salina.1